MITQFLDAWAEGYLSFLLDVQKKSPGTIRDIRCTLRRVMRYMTIHFPGIPLWKLSLQNYLNWLEFGRNTGKSVGYLAKDIVHIRGLINFALRSGKCDHNVLDGFNLQDAKPDPVIPKFLELDEMRILIERLPRRSQTDRKNRLVVLLLYGCGLRTSELRNLDVGDVDLERQEIFIRLGKGSKERRIPVPGAVWLELLVYLTERGGKTGPLFKTDEKKRRIPTPHICEVVRWAGIRANLDRPVVPMMLRHSFATHLIHRGVDIAVIAMLMGHRSPRETGVYLHALKGKKEEAVNRLNVERGDDDDVGILVDSVS